MAKAKGARFLLASTSGDRSRAQAPTSPEPEGTRIGAMPLVPALRRVHDAPMNEKIRLLLDQIAALDEDLP